MSGGGSKSQVIGYIYYFGIFMGICRGPVNGLTAIRVGDKGVWWTNFHNRITTNRKFAIEAGMVFGGLKKEGGIVGDCIAMFGRNDQTCPADLAPMLGGTPQPGFRGAFTLFFDGMISAMNPYPKAWKMRQWRTTAGWQNNDVFYPEKATIVLNIRPET